MKKIFLFTFVCLISVALPLNAAFLVSKTITKEIPEGTICIKHPMANNTTKFFSTTTQLSFELFKPGSKAEFVEIINKLKKVEGVENCMPGNITGDYYAVNLTLKSTKNKEWFINAFKSANLNYVKINNGDAISVEKI